jgi:hypothetical protein
MREWKGEEGKEKEKGNRYCTRGSVDLLGCVEVLDEERAMIWIDEDSQLGSVHPATRRLRLEH